MQSVLTDFLTHFEKNKHDLTVLRCAYVYGPSGSGKTRFVMTTLKAMGYDVVSYNAGDVRNKTIIDNINMSSSNVMSMLRYGTAPKKIAVVMDEIECMNNGDKGGINALIKLVRPKKTKKQLSEEVTHTPIICIGNNHVDKKVAELMKCSFVLEIPKPTTETMTTILKEMLPDMEACYPSIIAYAEGDLKKMTNICNVVKKTGQNVVDHFESRPLVEDAKQCVKRILVTAPTLSEHSIIHETDRTIVSMLWHENVADIVAKLDDPNLLYNDVIGNICYADYVDRVTFQKQAWQMNEMSSIIKTFYVNHLVSQKWSKKKMGEVRFTKMLTKYSTEYNNAIFILKLCQALGLDKKDMFAYMVHARQTKTAEQIAADIGSEDITAVDVNRMFRFLDKAFNIDH
jgi:hypothetical protein